MIYPEVAGEYETLEKIKQGFSIARFGDGEFKVMEGHGYAREEPNKKLSAELRDVMRNPADKCLIGIPTMNPKGSRYRVVNRDGSIVGWERHKARFAKHLPKRDYYSAFISRPDCGTWMLTRDYAEAVQSIWLGKSVAVIGSADNKIAKAVEITQPVKFIECPFRGAYAEIDNLQRKALEAGVDMVIISAGVTATCLANRLSPLVQAVDLGSIGGFLVKMLGAEKWND